MALTAELWCVAAFLGLTAAAVATVRARWSGPFIYSGAFAVSMLALLVASLELAEGAGGEGTIVLPLGLPWLGAHFQMDALTAFFLVIVNLGGAMASLFALGYGAHETAPHRVVPFYPAFLAAMNLVLLASDAFGFLVSWEFMSLASWALVLAHHREGDNARAAYVYLLMASFGTLALLLAFGMLAGADGGYSFDAMREAAHSPTLGAAVLALALVGAGSKAGLVPLHVWLPLAHPAAPSHVSALMSGVMTKVAVYGFIRIVFDLVGSPEWWWGMVVLAPAAASAVLGVLYALMERDLKRLLAYSTVENIGFVFVGLGLALAFWANNVLWAAALAMTAALLHALNHSLFKSALFFGAGAVLAQTGVRDLEKLGGLIHRMPHTALAFLVAAAAISALPPLNGFVSEWLTFQAVLVSPATAQWGLRLTIPAVGALLALAAALAGACFIRAFGFVFLGRARSREAEIATETDPFSIVAMFALCILMLVIGVLPGFAIDFVSPAVNGLIGGAVPRQADVPWLSIAPIAEARSSYNGMLVFVFIFISSSLAIITIHYFASRAVRREDPWDCGYGEIPVAAQYSASSFAQPIRRVFGTLVFRATEKVEMPPPGDPRPARLEVVVRDPIWDTLYAPIAGAVAFAADKLNVLQFLTIRRYLALVFFALVMLLLGLAIWP
jgi:hydrogenase-4 component B